LEKNLNDDEKLQKEEKDKKLSEVKDENLDNTVFLSNLTYELTDKEFRDFANNFGPFEYAKVPYHYLFFSYSFHILACKKQRNFTKQRNSFYQI